MVILSRRASSQKNRGVLRADMFSASLMQSSIFHLQMEFSAPLWRGGGEWWVMSTGLRTATVAQSLEEMNHHFEVVFGLPIVDVQFKCIGVLFQERHMQSITLSYSFYKIIINFSNFDNKIPVCLDVKEILKICLQSYFSRRAYV